MTEPDLRATRAPEPVPETRSSAPVPAVTGIPAQLQSWHWKRPDPLGGLYTRYPLRLLVHDHVGLDLGSQWIKYAVTRQGGGASRILAAGGVPVRARGKGEMGKIRAQVGALLAIRERIPQRNQRWIVGVSGPGTIVRSVEVPRMPRRELHKAVLWQAQKKIPFPLDEANVAIRYLRSRPNQPVRAVVAAAIRRMVDDLLYLLAEAEIQPTAITLPAFGLGSLLEQAGFRQPGEYYGMLDIGAERSLFAVYHGSTMEFFREIDLGIEDVEEILADNTQISLKHGDLDQDQAGALLFNRGVALTPDHDSGSDATAAAVNEALEKLLLEIQSTLEYYAAQSGGLRINTFLLLGGGAEIPGIDRHLSNFLEIPVKSLSPFSQGVNAALLESDEVADPATWASAYGYSLLPRRVANLLPSEYLRQQDAEFRQLLWRSTTGTVLAVSLLLAGAEYYRGGLAANRLVALHARLAETNTRLESLGVQHLDATLAANRRWLSALSRQDINSATVLRTLADLAPHAIVLDRIDIHPGDSGWAHITISGEVRTDHEQNEVTLAGFVEHLESTKWFYQVALESYVTKRKSGYEQIVFTLSMRAPLEASRQ